MGAQKKLEELTSEEIIDYREQYLADILDRDKKIFDLLGNVQKTLLSAPALNGGFDKLVNKVEKIEISQEHLVHKLDSVHECLFEPDDGVYTRVRDIGQWQKNQEEKVEEIRKISEEVRTLKHWKEAEEKEEKHVEKKEQEVESALKELEKLKIWRDNANKFFWLVGGSTVAVFVKSIWDILSNHIVFK